jgi:hypothetical protein
MIEKIEIDLEGARAIRNWQRRQPACDSAGRLVFAVICRTGDCCCGLYCTLRAGHFIVITDIRALVLCAVKKSTAMEGCVPAGA